MASHYKRKKYQSQKAAVFSLYKAYAKRRLLPFTLSFGEFERLIISRCAYCGALPSNIRRNGKHAASFLYQGIDRDIGEVGYTVENSVPCCIKCNRAKGSKTVLEFLAYRG